MSRSLADTDPAVSETLENEARRQRTQIELIASGQEPGGCADGRDRQIAR